MTREKVWTTKEGKEIPYKDLEDSHLLNILKFVKKRAKELDGKIIDCGGLWDLDDMWFIEGSEKEWLQKFGYNSLLKEAKSRGISNN